MKRIRTLVAALLAACCQAAQAAIVECDPVPGQFTVFLSEPTGLMTDKAQLRQFLQKLQFELDQGRDARWINAQTTEVRFVSCFNRAPALDGSEFSTSLVDGLHSGRVLLEIWGTLANEAVSGEPPRLSAQMNYLLVPMRFATDQREPSAPALQRLRYPEQGAQPTADAVQLISRPLDIDAFVASALGFKLLREQSLDLAHANLCRAHALLGVIAKRPLAGRSKADLAALHQFVLDGAGQAVRQALAEPRYPKTGLLRLQLPAQACAGQE